MLFGDVLTGLGERTIQPACQHGQPSCLAHTHALKYAPVSPTTLNAHVHALMSFPQEQIEARDDRKAKPQIARRRRIDYYHDRFRESRGSRGGQAARDANIDAARAHARLWAGLGSARLRLARRLSCCICHRLCGPTLRGCWGSRPAQARAI